MGDATEQQENSEKRVIGRPFPPGVSGNPTGRPKGSKTLITLIRERLQENPEKQQAIVDAFLEAMGKASFQHLKEFIDRESGKVPDRVANADGSNIDGFDESRLTLEELIVLRNLQRKAAVRSPAFGSGDLPTEPQ